MTAKIAEVLQSKFPTNLPGCKRDNCRLRVTVADDIEECLMESVRKLWTNPFQARYCDEQYACKFVEFINSKQVNAGISNNLTIFGPACTR